ncbi:MAG TPA: aldehyde dehydrogenase family protein [Planctomycetaceae bacterium]|nr:aldehyde dehydrogenase family protein [Planctomycetaceae bacterium]
METLTQYNQADVRSYLKRLNVPTQLVAISSGGKWRAGSGDTLNVQSPIDGSELASFNAAGREDLSAVLETAVDAFGVWQLLPAPRRGEFVRRIGDRLRDKKNDLAAVVTVETGKIMQEALGEVQEMIDICDFAVGLSRQLYGLTIASERPQHRLSEIWQPLGPIGVISAFNFPVAVWAWNAMIAWICGDVVVWKPSEKTPLCAIACQSIVQQVIDEMPDVPPGISSLIIGDGTEVGQAMAAAEELPLISATGSIPMGRNVAQTVAARLGRSLLELGGNNAAIVTPNADLEHTVRSVVFAAVGTCGQRCTSLRRLIVHTSIAENIVSDLRRVYKRLPVGNPFDAGVLVGPLIDETAARNMAAALQQAVEQGGSVFAGEVIDHDVPTGGVYVAPAIVEIGFEAPIVQQETFAPILYVLRYDSLEEAIQIQNDVPQGLASSIFTNDLCEAELFCSPAGSDCGIVNVNIGPSGAEIGGAFGGEKQTGGGRESGSDAWKSYMRRVTSTVNYSGQLPLAQGIKFDL